MAATTLPAIIRRFQAVLEGADLNLSKSQDEFSFDTVPNAKINDVYRVEEAGLDETLIQTGDLESRIDRLVVWMASKATPTSEAVRHTLLTRIGTLQQKVIADGPANSYHAMYQGNETQRLGDVIVSRTEFTVDYDYATA